MYKTPSIIFSSVLGIFVFSLLLPSAFADSCPLFENAYTQKLLPAKQEIEDKLKNLTTKPDTSTPYLTAQGVTYLRDYRAKIQQVCDDIPKDQGTCTVISQEQLSPDAQDVCNIYVAQEMDEQQKNFEKFMIFDAGMKKYQFIVNKYIELNKKFRDLVALIGFIKGELDNLLKNVGEYFTKQQAQGS